MIHPTCTHHNDQQREKSLVCRVAALTAERDQLRSRCDQLIESQRLSDSAMQEQFARAEKAEAALLDPQQLHAHCLRSLNEGQIAHLFGERMTEIVNRAARAEAELATERARLRQIETHIIRSNYYDGFAATRGAAKVLHEVLALASGADAK